MIVKRDSSYTILYKYRIVCIILYRSYQRRSLLSYSFHDIAIQHLFGIFRSEPFEFLHQYQQSLSYPNSNPLFDLLFKRSKIELYCCHFIISQDKVIQSIDPDRLGEASTLDTIYVPIHHMIGSSNSIIWFSLTLLYSIGNTTVYHGVSVFSAYSILPKDFFDCS